MSTHAYRLNARFLALLLLSAFLAEEVVAIVGRPLTPVSVAGVSRRTVRRSVVVTTPRR